MKGVLDMLNSSIRIIKKYAVALLIVAICIASIVLMQIKAINSELEVKAPDYHFYFIAQSATDPFWEKVEEGVRQAASDFNVYVEYVSPRFSNANEAYKYLDIATISDVDGIITYVPRLEAYSHRIDLADEKKIPVITIDSDASSSKRQVYIGSNSYNFGKEAAKLVYESTAGIAKIAVISNEDIGNDTIEYDLKMRGFIDFLKEQPRMKIEKVYTSQMGVISAEEITQDIISNHPDVNAILTLSASDTLGSARLIVDRNRVGKVKLVGTGSSDKINDYINKGIIHSTIESDGYSMGYKSIETMININKGLYSPTYIYTQINIQKKRR